MGQFRNVLRGVTHALDASPAAVLCALDRAAADLIVDTLATAVRGRMEATTADGGRTLH